ncbi:peroxisomal ATPase PEX6 isoform X2 [Festucalex cinctus]
MAAQVELLRLEPFPPHASPLDVLVSKWQLRCLLRDHSEPPTVFFTPKRPPPRPREPAILLHVQVLSDEEAGPPPPPGPVRLFASGFFLRLRGLPAAGSLGTARPVLPVSLDEVVLGARGGGGGGRSLERDDADWLAAKLLELCRDGRCLLARRGEPLFADRPGQVPDVLVLSCRPVTQGRVTPDTAVVLADCADWPAPPPRALRLCASDFAHSAARLAGGRSLLDPPRGSRLAVPEEAERRLDVRVTPDARRWPEADVADADARLYVGGRALLRLGMFDGEWVKLWAAGRADRWRAAALARSDRADDDDGCGGVSETLWFNLTGGRPTAGAACCLKIQRWRRRRPQDGAAGSNTYLASPPPAGEVHLRPVPSPADRHPGACDDLLAEHFAVPRLVAPGDVLRVPARNRPDLTEDGAGWRWRALLFLVQRVCPLDRAQEEEEEEEEGGGGYLADTTHTSLFMGPPVNSLVPGGAARLWSGPSPAGLERAVDAVGRVLGPHAHRGSLPACRLLVHGPAGSGKVTAVAAAGSRLHLQLIKVDCAGVYGDTPAATEARLTSCLERADALQPCVLLLRNLQLLLRPRGGADEDSRVQAALCHALRSAPGRVAVVATVREPRRLPAGVAAAFVHRVALEIPTEDERRAVLTQLSGELPLDRDVDLERLAKVTAGLVLGDLRALLVEAGRAACRRLATACAARGEVDVCCSGVVIQQRDFLSALQAFQDRQSEAAGAPKIPCVRWEDVGGLDDAKKDILETVQLPLQHPLLSSGMDLSRTGILLYGPPGTGKTLLAKAVATECSMTFLSVKGPELLNMYVGQSEENVREVFERARSAAPCVVFFDELDSLAPSRGRSGDSGGVMDRVVSQLLAELDALNASARVFVIGATNRPDLLDQSLLRPGRFDKLVYVGVDTDPSSQMQVLRAVLRNFRLDASVDLRRVLERCPAHVSGADLYALCSDAMTAAVKRKIGAAPDDGLDAEDWSLSLTTEDFDAALADFVPSLSPQEVMRYQRLQEKSAHCGSSVADSSFAYFISACVVILLAILSYAALPKLEFFKFHRERKAAHVEDVNVALTQSAGAEEGKSRRAGVSMVTVFKKIWPLAACVCATFTVTIGTFPAVAADAKSTLAAGGRAWERYFVPVWCFLLFNVSDWAGRSLTAICSWPGRDSRLLPVLVASRAALVPALMLCNVQPRRHLPVLFRHDAFFAAFMLLFAFTNGYLASLAMCFGPKKVLPHEAETAGSIMAFFLSLGLALGAALSFVLRALV